MDTIGGLKSIIAIIRHSLKLNPLEAGSETETKTIINKIAAGNAG